MGPISWERRPGGAVAPDGEKRAVGFSLMPPLSAGLPAFLTPMWSLSRAPGMCELRPPRAHVHLKSRHAKEHFMSRVASLCTLLALIALAGCQATTGGHSSAGTNSTTTTTTGAKTTTTAPAPPGLVTLPDGLKYQDLAIGDGAIAENGLEASVHY